MNAMVEIIIIHVNVFKKYSVKIGCITKYFSSFFDGPLTASLTAVYFKKTGR